MAQHTMSPTYSADVSRHRVLLLTLTALAGVVLAVAPTLVVALHDGDTAHHDDGHPCIHDQIAAAEDIHNITYVQVKRRAEVDNGGGAAGQSPQASAAGRRYRDVTFTPRRGAQPASVDFTVDGAATTATTTAEAASLSGSSTSESWQPLRIRAFYEDLLDSDRYCTAVGDPRPDFSGSTISCASTQDILTDRKKDILMNTLVPTAIAMHMERLNVQRVPSDSAIVVSDMPGKWCGSFTVPEEHKTTGVTDADFVVYVAAGPTSTPASFVAWAIGCQYFAGSNRPAVGAIYFNPRYLVEQADETASDIANGGIANSVLDNRIRVAAHELLHALGFSYNPFQRAGMVSTVSSLRGKPTATVINTPAVRKAAMAHYGCTDEDSFPGMELEDQGASGTSGSHWKRRNARDELMSPVANFMRYTAITLAAMEDLGYYRVNTDKAAEYMGWGNNAGCTMLTEKCIVEPSDPISTSPSIFCSETSGSSTTRYCTRDRLNIGRCYIATYTSSLPVYMQYFENPTLGGGESYVDYCPTVQAYSNAACADGAVSVMPGSVTGATARCFTADSTAPLGIKNGAFGQQDAICATVQCNFTTNVYHVLFSGASSYVECVPGTTVEPAKASPSVFQSGGLVHCPPFNDVCSANPRANFALPAPTPSTDTDTARLPIGRAQARLTLILAMLVSGTALLL